MQYNLILFSLLVSLNCFAAKQLSLGAIGIGDRLFLNSSVTLPKDHRLNKGAPSNLQVFEKANGNWVLTEKVNLNDFFSLTELINLQKPVRLRSASSELKITMSLYHCPFDHKGLCVIDDFEGFVKRNKKQVSTELQFTVAGTDPKKY